MNTVLYSQLDDQPITVIDIPLHNYQYLYKNKFLYIHFEGKLLRLHVCNHLIYADSDELALKLPHALLPGQHK